MAYTKKAIEMAIESGWRPNWSFPLITLDTCDDRFMDELVIFDKEKIFLDPEFWKCLGESLGWGFSWEDENDIGNNEWMWHWHRLIDHLAKGKNSESYFEELLNE